MKVHALVDAALKAYHLVVPPKIDREIQRALRLPQPDFPHSITLPANYGRGMTERVVELLIARLTYQPGKHVLDVGHANIMNAHARMLKTLPRPLTITGVDIASPSEEIRSLYTESVRASITGTNFPDESFDLIWCISTLEHFGMDNSLYTTQFIVDQEMDLKAVQEMIRILRRDGTLYISVPYGKYEDLGWLRNYDQARWQQLLAVARPVSRVSELYFKYSDEHGWKVARPDELVDTGYSDHDNAGASGLAVALIHKMR